MICIQGPLFILFWRQEITEPYDLIRKGWFQGQIFFQRSTKRQQILLWKISQVMSMQSLRHKGKGKRKKEACSLISELDIIFAMVGLQLPRWDPEISHSSRIVFTAGLWFRPTINISENWLRYAFLYLVNHTVNIRGLKQKQEPRLGITRGPWPLFSLLKPLTLAAGLHYPTPVLTTTVRGNASELFYVHHC